MNILFYYIYLIRKLSNLKHKTLRSNNMLGYDPSLGNLNRFLSGALSFEPETNPKIFPYDVELAQTPLPEWVPDAVTLRELMTYIKFKHKCREYCNLSEEKMLMTFNFTIGVYKFADSLMQQAAEEYEAAEVAALEAAEAATRKVAEQKTVHVDENYIFIKGYYWKRFNGFMNLSNSLYPIGKFAPRCHRCATFGVFRGLIPCYIVTEMKGLPYQCMAELCTHCFWLYRKIQLNTTAKLRLTSEFLEYVYLPENQKHMTHVNYMLYRDVPKGSIFPESNIWVKTCDSDRVYGLFKTMEYPANPPRAIRTMDIVPDWDPSTMYEMEHLIHDQEQRTRKRHYEEAFAYEHVLPYEGQRSRSVSEDFDSDIHQILVSNDIEKRSRLRKKAVGLEVFNDTTKPYKKRAYKKRAYKKRGSYKKKP